MAGRFIRGFLSISWIWLGCAVSDAQTLFYDPLPSPYSESTAVVCNRNLPQSMELARYYAEARGIPENNIIILECPTTEEISRDEYERQIEKPIRSTMLRRQWWIPSRDPETGLQDVQSKIRVVVLMHGVPLKIRGSGGGDRDRNPASSVDSELTILSQPGLPWDGPLTNPYFQETKQLPDFELPILLAGRIDGPNPDTCRRMIDDAIAAERSGLWGNAYVDLNGTGGRADTSLESAAANLRRIGITAKLDRYDVPFPPTYPFRDPIVFLSNSPIQGKDAFTAPGFKFVPGAIAYHMDPASGTSLLRSEEHWAGPLLEKGAAAVLAHVMDPTLELSFQPEIFADRLTRGFTLVESAYAASPSLSWMGVVIGDPLYVPFSMEPLRKLAADLPENSALFQEADPKTDPYKILRLAYLRWGKGKDLPEGNVFYRLELAVARRAEGVILENLALGLWELNDEIEVRIQLDRARNAYENPLDKLRVDLHLAELEFALGNRLAAYKALQATAEEFAILPEAKSIDYLREIVQRPIAPTSP